MSQDTTHMHGKKEYRVSRQDHYRVISKSRLAHLHEIELNRFISRTQKSAALLERGKKSMIKGVPMPWMFGLYRHPSLFVEKGSGSVFSDVDGNRYIDFNVVDLAMTMGFANPHITAAIGRAMETGAHFLLPVPESISVTEELASRTGVPYWQFTLSASGANTEVIRIARSITGRGKVMVFEGHYHGHLDDTLVEKSNGRLQAEGLGLPAGVELNVEMVPFNDLAAAEEVLRHGKVAVVITEPALSNCTLVKPEPGYLEGLYELAHRHGSLLCLDEAHNFSFAYGGLKRAWNLPCDFLVLGKGLGTGVPFGLYGMSEKVASFVDAHTAADLGEPGIAAGGTTYANTLAVFAAQAALENVLTPAAYQRLDQLGALLANGLQRVFNELELPWKALHLGPRSGYCMSTGEPRNGSEASASIDVELIAARKLFMANRGIWDAMPTAGPQVSFVHDEAEVELYLGLAREFLRSIKI
jgi:glutamate-1-semialdehyde 2,1-aminomutase